MKTVILAGGFGTRLPEETEIKPKPMVKIGDRPILWHIMKYYAAFGFNEFIIALGYKGEVVKEYFLNYRNLWGGLTINLRSNQIEIHDTDCDEWMIHLIDTGLHTSTGGRLKRLEPWLKDNIFMLTYGDGLSNVDLKKLIDFHRNKRKIGTITSAHPPARFGEVVLNKTGEVAGFYEKAQTGVGWINSGFMVFEPEVFKFLRDDNTVLEADVLEELARIGQLAAYCHDGFWQCMDTLRDKRQLENKWLEQNPPWKVWK